MPGFQRLILSELKLQSMPFQNYPRLRFADKGVVLFIVWGSGTSVRKVSNYINIQLHP